VQVASAFHHARNYDRHAIVQRAVAEGLAQRILALDLPAQPRVLEIGCGTGFLGAGLIGRLNHAHYWMTDIAPGMLDRARTRFAGCANISFAQMDGARPTIEGPFDLICSSLAMQWIDDLPESIALLRALLAPGGRLAFTTLAEGSFAEWRSAYRDVMPGTPDYPSAEALQAIGLDISIESIEQRYPNARGFLAALKAIGAQTPQSGYHPLPHSALRQVMARFEAAGARTHYVVATCVTGADRED